MTPIESSPITNDPGRVGPIDGEVRLRVVNSDPRQPGDALLGDDPSAADLDVDDLAGRLAMRLVPVLRSAGDDRRAEGPAPSPSDVDALAVRLAERLVPLLRVEMDDAAAQDADQDAGLAASTPALTEVELRQAVDVITARMARLEVLLASGFATLQGPAARRRRAVAGSPG